MKIYKYNYDYCWIHSTIYGPTIVAQNVLSANYTPNGSAKSVANVRDRRLRTPIFWQIIALRTSSLINQFYKYLD